jgi:hypothetical protein
MPIDFGDLIALIALLLGIYSTYKSRKFNKLQEEVMLLEKDLNKLLLKKEMTETTRNLKADISANIIKLGNRKEKFKIYNKGKGTAKNIRFEEIGDSKIIILCDEIFPLELLEPFQSVELSMITHDGCASKIKIRLTWDDDSGKNHSKELVVTR